MHTHVKVLTLFLVSRLSEVLYVLVYSFLPTFVYLSTRGLYECLRKRRTTQIKLTFAVKFNFFTLFEFLMRKFCSPYAEISSN